MPLGGPSSPPSFLSHYFDIIDLFSFDRSNRSIDRSVVLVVLLSFFISNTRRVNAHVKKGLSAIHTQNPLSYYKRI